MPKSQSKADAAAAFDEAYESLRNELDMKRMTGAPVSQDLARCAKYMTQVKPYFFPDDEQK